MQTGGPNSAKIELAHGVNAKKETSAKQEFKFESQDEEKMKIDHLWLQVKGEIKEEIEREEQEKHTCKSSSLDVLTREEIMMKEEMEKEAKHDGAFDHVVATQERKVEKSNKASNSQAAAEPEPKPVAKRRRLTRRDVQQTMQTGGPSSAIESADGVKVKKEKAAEQNISFERQDKHKMELDDLWLRVHKEVKLTFAAANSPAAHAPKPPEGESGASQVQMSTQQQLGPSADEDCFGDM